jgi:hypothetical protein
LPWAKVWRRLGCGKVNRELLHFVSSPKKVKV